MSIYIYQIKNLDKKRISKRVPILLLILVLIFTQFSNASKGNAATTCSAGTFDETVTGNVHVLTFLSNGTVDATCQLEVPENVYTLDYLIVAGGGGGNSGGGGAGGLVTSWEVLNQAGTTTIAARSNPLGVTPGDLLNIKVGIGGTRGSGGNYNEATQDSFQLGTNGQDSILGGIIAKGGGRGGFGFGCEAGDDISACDQRGASGGSNGGAAYDNASVNNTLVSGTAYVGATSRGNIGGASVGSGGYRAGSGGGGAGTAGASANVLHVGGAGGAGASINISGTSIIYACGGGGGINENITWFADPAYGYINQTTNVFLRDDLFYGLFTYDHNDDDFAYYMDVNNNSDYWTFNYLTGEFTSPSGEIWISGDSGEPAGSFYDGVSGGGAGGCEAAGRGSNIGVYGPWGPSSLSNATSGTNNFGHGGGGTDPESTVAGNGGSGVVIVRYTTQDSNCPNDHNAGGVSTPIACIAAVTISADGNSVSTFVAGAPISYTTSANSPTVTILNTPSGLTSSVSSGNLVVSAPTNSSLAGGTYPLRYRITEGGTTSDSVLLVTVTDPGQHSPVLVLVDPRATEVILPEIVVGNINATLVCVTPRAGGVYPNHPVIDVTQSVSNIAKTLYTDSGGIRLIDNSNNNAPASNAAMQEQVQFIKISKNSLDEYLLPSVDSRILDINVSNTATGGNGSCRGGTASSVELRPIGVDQILRKGSVVLKN
jgi:hypothetical protein